MKTVTYSLICNELLNNHFTNRITFIHKLILLVNFMSTKYNVTEPLQVPLCTNLMKSNQTYICTYIHIYYIVMATVFENNSKIDFFRFILFFI